MPAPLRSLGPHSNWAPLGLRLGKEALSRVEFMPVDEGYALEQEYSTKLMHTEDAREATRAVLEKSGFTVHVWRDVTAEARQWFAALRPPAQPPKLGLHLLMGPDFRTMAGNFGRNVMEGRVGLLMAVCEKT